MFLFFWFDISSVVLEMGFTGFKLALALASYVCAGRIMAFVCSFLCQGWMSQEMPTSAELYMFDSFFLGREILFMLLIFKNHMEYVIQQQVTYYIQNVMIKNLCWTLSTILNMFLMNSIHNSKEGQVTTIHKHIIHSRKKINKQKHS